MRKWCSTGLACWIALGVAGSSAEDFGLAREDTGAQSISIFRFQRTLVGGNLQTLHRIQINDIDGLRKSLEAWVAIDAKGLWETIHDERASEEDRDRGYAMLRLMAVQNEKFPIATLSGDPEIAKILQAALAYDPAETERLRAQDWSNPR